MLEVNGQPSVLLLFMCQLPKLPLTQFYLDVSALFGFLFVCLTNQHQWGRLVR